VAEPKRIVDKIEALLARVNPARQRLAYGPDNPEALPAIGVGRRVLKLPTPLVSNTTRRGSIDADTAQSLIFACENTSTRYYRYRRKTKISRSPELPQ
jgi:hypothetical protein